MKKQINLYQPDCYPKRDQATFKQFIALLLGSVLAMVVLLVVLTNQLAQTQARAEQHKVLLSQKQTQLSSLVTQLQQNLAPQAKLQQQQDLLEEISARQQLLKSLSGVELTSALSFSQLLRGLSLADTPTITITEFSNHDGRLNISGEAKYSDSVALWLTKAHSTDELAEISFEKLAMQYNDSRKLFSFTLSNPVNEQVIEAPGQ